jgi:hypothetical protein
MNNLSLNNNYYNWNISSGDYYRSYESTERYEKKQIKKKKIEKLMKVILYMGVFFSLLILSIYA